MVFQNPFGKGTMGRGGLKRGRMVSFKKRSRGGAPAAGPIPAGAVRTLRSKRGARASARIRRARTAIRRRRR